MTDFAADLLAAFDRLGVTDRSLRAGIAAICFGESGFQPRTEASYAHTSNRRIRTVVFPSRCGNMTDAELDRLKADDRAFFDCVYGDRLGNTHQGDGYRYRGRGGNQLTGRRNYAETGKRIGVDLVGNPDLANDPATAALIAVDYMLERGARPGWSFEAMKRAVGNPVAETEAVKDEAYARYMASGEWGPFDIAAGGAGGASGGSGSEATNA